MPLFWETLDTPDRVAASALKVILLTGQRPGEVAHMRREHVRDGWWEMPGEPVPELGWPGTKNGASHRVWLPAPVRALIGEADSGYVFASARGGVVALAKPMRGICKSIGIPRLTPHDLRRSHGSTVTALGFGRDAMNRIQNHREGGIADVYDRHGYETETKNIMEAVAMHIMSLIDGRAADNVVAFR